MEAIKYAQKAVEKFFFWSKYDNCDVIICRSFNSICENSPWVDLKLTDFFGRWAQSYFILSHYNDSDITQQYEVLCVSLWYDYSV